MAHRINRIPFALAAGFVVVMGYAITIALIIGFSRKFWLIWYLGVPLSLPKTVYFHFYPPTAEDFSIRLTPRRIIFTFAAYAVNVLLYSIPFYILFSFIARRRGKVPAIQPAPPLPPSFDS